MGLKENIRKGVKNIRLDLDSFGEVMDKFIEESEIALVVTKEANSKDWEVHGEGCGAVMDFYIFLNALEPIFLQMLKEMKYQLDTELLAETLSGLMKETMITAAAEKGEGHDGRDQDEDGVQSGDE